MHQNKLKMDHRHIDKSKDYKSIRKKNRILSFHPELSKEFLDMTGKIIKKELKFINWTLSKLKTFTL